MKNARKSVWTFGLILLLWTPLWLSIDGATSPKSAAKAADELSVDRYRKHVTTLASPEYKGRGNGTPELEKAAEYIASALKSAGLQPAGERGTFFQTFQVTTGTSFGPANAIDTGQASLKLNVDFVPLNFSASTTVEAPVVFAGYGITAREFHFDEYQGIDAKDKIVVVFRHEPQELDAKSPFNGTDFTTHASFINKAINAKQHGAKAIVFITDPNNHPASEDAVGRATRGTEGDDAGIAAVHSMQAPILELFKRGGKDLATLQKEIDQELEPRSFELAGMKVKLTADIRRERRPVRNVLASIQGSDPKLRDEWVVIGAHYDHLGLGDNHSLAPSDIGKIHHGADDNASGTAGVLEMARVLAKNRGLLQRSILFMTFAGEELGLLGSAHFANSPTVPMDRVVAMLNMDMIGRLSKDKIYVGGVGTAPTFRPWVEEMAPALNLQIDYSDEGFGSSDHTSFYIKQVPVMFFFSGLHADYHKPSDTAEKINTEGALKVMKLAFGLTDRIVNAEERPKYTRVEQPRPPGGGSGDSGYGPYFGSIPDFREGITGVAFADVRPDSPAAKAGLKSNDIMVEFDGKAIQNLYDFTYALRGKKAGDVVVVVVKRGNETVRVDVTLESRK